MVCLLTLLLILLQQFLKIIIFALLNAMTLAISELGTIVYYLGRKKKSSLFFFVDWALLNANYGAITVSSGNEIPFASYRLTSSPFLSIKFWNGCWLKFTYLCQKRILQKHCEEKRGREEEKKKNRFLSIAF